MRVNVGPFDGFHLRVENCFFNGIMIVAMNACFSSDQNAAYAEI
jgi:hypothetical protein